MSKQNKIIILFAMIIPCSLLIPMLFQSNMSNIAAPEEFSLETKISFAPSLTEPTVNPPTGNTDTVFTYQVKYTDPDGATGNPPVFIHVVINDTAHNMTKQDLGDNNYLDGCIYIYSTTLAVGNYTYLFNTSDGVYQVNTTVFLGPMVTASSSSIPGFLSWVVFIGIIGATSIIASLKRRAKEML